MNEERCDNCMFVKAWESKPIQRVFYLCRRYPPTVVCNEDDQFPAVPHDDWCGEWQSKRESEGAK